MSEAIRNLGIETQLFHRGTLPVNRWDPEFSQVVLEELQRHGVEFVKDAETKAVEAGNQVQAARLLGITRATLRKRIEKFGIHRELNIK